MYNER